MMQLSDGRTVIHLRGNVFGVADPGGNPLKEVAVRHTALTTEAVAAVEAALAEVASPPAPTLGEIKGDAIEEMKRLVDKRLAMHVRAYPAIERETWARQEAAARAVLAGTAEDWQAAYIDSLAVERGVDRTAMASLIAAKADASGALSSAAIGARARCEAAIAAATDEAGVRAAIDRLRSELSAL